MNMIENNYEAEVYILNRDILFDGIQAHNPKVLLQQLA